MGTEGSRALLPGLLLFVVGVFVGLGGAEFLSAADSPEANRDEQRIALPARHPERTTTDDAGLTAALLELSMTMDSLRQSLERSASRPDQAPARVPVGSDRGPAALDETKLATSLNSLAAAIRSIPRGGSGAADESGLVVPGWVDRTRAFATEDLRETYRTDEDGHRSEAANKAFRLDHMFWTKQQVLSRYGKPDEIYTDDGFVEWCYQVNRAKEYEDVDFSFDNGVVVGVQYEYDWE